jgi:hypothetical protein
MPSVCHMAVTSYARSPTQAAGLSAVDPPWPRAPTLRRRRAAPKGQNCGCQSREIGSEGVQGISHARVGAALGGDEQPVARDLDEPFFRDGAAHAAALAAAVWLLIAGITFSAISSIERRPSRLSAQSWLA